MYEIQTEYGTLRLDDADVYLVDGRRVTIRKGGIHRPQYTVYVGGRRLTSLLMEPPPGMQVDHINHDQLDNRRENLRIATRSQNLAHRRGWGKNMWGYKGLVYRDRGAKGKVWEARSTSCGPGKYVGQSANPHRAALKWNKATIAAYGGFAYLNDVPCFAGEPLPRNSRCGGCNAQCYCCCVC